jgi:hypothetical protein
MFRAYLGPSTGGTTVCIQQLVHIILFRSSSWLSLHDYMEMHGQRNVKLRKLLCGTTKTQEIGENFIKSILTLKVFDVQQ